MDTENIVPYIIFSLYSSSARLSEMKKLERLFIADILRRQTA